MSAHTPNAQLAADLGRLKAERDEALSLLRSLDGDSSPTEHIDTKKRVRALLARIDGGNK